MITPPVAGSHRDLEGVVVALHAQGYRRAGGAAGPQLAIEVGDFVENVAVQGMQDVAALQAGAIGRAAVGYAADHELAHVLDGVGQARDARVARWPFDTSSWKSASGG